MLRHQKHPRGGEIVHSILEGQKEEKFKTPLIQPPSPILANEYRGGRPERLLLKVMDKLEGVPRSKESE